MNQPNDLAITKDGVLYSSDPNWQASTGQLWRIDKDGKATRIAEGMGTTNGIEVSPDGKFIATGGRVLGVTAAAENLPAALSLCYDTLAKIHWPGMQFRRDIGRSK